MRYDGAEEALHSKEAGVVRDAASKFALKGENGKSAHPLLWGWRPS